MATCRRCVHWDRCLKEDGTTRYYGEKIAAGNVERLCAWFVPTAGVTSSEDVRDISFLIDDKIRTEGKEMNISVKCNCCAHENVCAKTESYKSACKKINDVTSAYETGLVSVSIRCEHFMSKAATPKGMNTEVEG